MEKKDFYNLTSFVKSVSPLFQRDSRTTNYGDFERRSHGISSDSSASSTAVSTSSASNISSSVNKDHAVSADVAAATILSTPDSPSAARKRKLSSSSSSASGAGDDDSHLRTAVESSSGGAPTTVTPPKPRLSLQFYNKDDESKDYSTFGGAGRYPRPKSAGFGSSATSSMPLADAPLSALSR